ncbi:Por secretion system C-terminal sorting domain-containing protein [Dyadobacter sp. SG02]|uniref:T9SS type A sorting domain-containing protein n=1 Tax=Dyadobacter sp. SG02 TaxID=1855291 RepID=UPI0008B784C4|nr:T9SS type A sorting domain-containing protein [Dyadobacter sp. SG02]SEJ82759.1 Por secretion system C-terminal sorting domain-containing protein [Dyadobacter sp. SG02]
MKIHLLCSALAALMLTARTSFSQTLDIPFPAGPGNMTRPSTIVLTNGNFVVSNREYDEGGKTDIGIVYLFDGQTKKLISTLKGSTSNDKVGEKLYALPNGNFVVVSTYWDNGAITDVGAATWVNGVTGLDGVVSAANSLIGNVQTDVVGNSGVTVLPNGNYLVRTDYFKSPGKLAVGAVTWCNGNTGLAGHVSAANSLLGANAGDALGYLDILILSNGNYVVPCPGWDSPTAQNVGAVVFGNGSTGVSGVISAANALTGSHADDRIGNDFGLIGLTNGNYLVKSTGWDNGNVQNVGAVTFCNGNTGLTGVVSAANSLVGTAANQYAGGYTVALKNGNYVVSSSGWSNAAAEAYGAVTWGNGVTGTTGPITEMNSLYGSRPGDAGGAYPLANGNYVVRSHMWTRDGIYAAGAITWADGTTGITGRISTANSLVGRDTLDNIGLRGVVALSNGHYVVASPFRSSDGQRYAGAVTWCDGFKPTTGEVSELNSFVGTEEYDDVANIGITPLTNGNYVIQSSFMEINGVDRAGAITWADGSKELVGSVNASNSIFGSQPVDLIGRSITPLKNGNYLIVSTNWDNGNIAEAGAITWANGTAAITGEVNAANSFVGTTPGGSMGKYGTLEILPDDNYIVKTIGNNVGAITWGNGSTGTTGEVNDCNSYLGAGDGVYNVTYGYVVTVIPNENVVRLVYRTGGPLLAMSQDAAFTDISSGQTSSFMGGAGCRTIATVASQGANPIAGTVNARTWVESGVPSFHGDPFVARHYEITPAQNAASATGRITLYFSQGEFIAFNAVPGSKLDLPVDANDTSGKANLRIGKYAGTSSDGTGLPGSYASILSTIIDPDDNDIVWNDTFKRWEVTFDTEGFSGFVIQTTTEPLPVRLVSFSAKPEGKAVNLAWEIADAVNFSHFEIEHSVDGKQFEWLGNENHITDQESYAMTDYHPQTNAQGQVYYRLKMVDIDESYAYSKIVSVHFDNSAAYVYPNPVTDQLRISLPGQNGKAATLRLINVAGQAVLTKAVSVSNGEVRADLKSLHISDGIYHVELTIGNDVRQFKFLKGR